MEPRSSFGLRKDASEHFLLLQRKRVNCSLDRVVSSQAINRTSAATPLINARISLLNFDLTRKLQQEKSRILDQTSLLNKPSLIHNNNRL